MQSVVLSPDRLRDTRRINLFCEIFSTHSGIIKGGEGRKSSEFERLEVVPLVFGLMPRQALVRPAPDARVKPLIRSHLDLLGIPKDEVLVTVIKHVVDQYFKTVVEPAATGRRPRKYGVEHIRALRRGTYRRLRETQNGRCAICGSLFDSDASETLDHILPWCLVGDSYDGSNWQLLCDECNRGKRDWLSSLQSPAALNWIYRAQNFGLPPHDPTTETRYMLLAATPACQVESCTQTARTGKLFVCRRYSSGIPVADNLVVLCETHSVAPESGPVQVVLGQKTGNRDTPVQLGRTEEEEGLGEFGEYRLLRRAKQGGMAQSFVAIHEETGEEVFLKIVDADTFEGQCLVREATIYQKLDLRACQHVMAVREVVRSRGQVGLVCECADGDLEEFVLGRGGRLATDEVGRVAQQIAQGLAELHDLEVVHRDLKPSNVLYKGDQFLLTDFGISKDMTRPGTQRTFRGAGTGGYAAPEQLLSGREAQPSADVYSLGKVMVYMLTGTTDIDHVPYKVWRRLVRRCTAESPQERPGLAEVISEIAEIDE